MSFHKLADVFKINGIEPMPRLLLAAIAWHINSKTGKCFPSAEQLSRATGMSRSSVFRNREDLVKLGLVAYTQSGRSSCVYELTELFKTLAESGATVPEWDYCEPSQSGTIENDESHSETVIVPERDGNSPSVGLQQSQCGTTGVPEWDSNRESDREVDREVNQEGNKEISCAIPEPDSPRETLQPDPEPEREGEVMPATETPQAQPAKPKRKRSTVYDPTAINMPEELDDPEFRAAWVEWCEHRKEKRKPLTERAAAKQIKECVSWGVEMSIAAIDNSIKNDWQGLFAPKGFTPSVEAEQDSGWSSTYPEGIDRKPAEQVIAEEEEHNIACWKEYGVTCEQLKVILANHRIDRNIARLENSLKKAMTEGNLKAANDYSDKIEGLKSSRQEFPATPEDMLQYRRGEEPIIDGYTAEIVDLALYA